MFNSSGVAIVFVLSFYKYSMPPASGKIGSFWYSSNPDPALEKNLLRNPG
ncbi:MAG: hypothetical protein M0R16_11235 [Bacteroidales bacterium]|nr:hypothetical protein [Bacteroidales bacterium]